MGRRILTILIVLSALFALAPLHTQATAPPRQIQRSYNIEIIVECMDEALEIVRDLPGFNVESGITQVPAPVGVVTRRANFTRRIDAWAFPHAQAVLRELGEVVSENERVQHLGAEITQLETRIHVVTQEMERLTIMMAASTTLNVLIAIDNQLSRVARERDRLTGRRNQLLSESQSAVARIQLTERVEAPEEEEGEEEPEPTFGARVAARFIASWQNLLRQGGNFIVFAARVGLPLLIWLAVGGIALLALAPSPLGRFVRKFSKNFTGKLANRIMPKKAAEAKALEEPAGFNKPAETKEPDGFKEPGKPKEGDEDA